MLVRFVVVVLFVLVRVVDVVEELCGFPFNLTSPSSSKFQCVDCLLVVSRSHIKKRCAFFFVCLSAVSVFSLCCVYCIGCDFVSNRLGMLCFFVNLHLDQAAVGDDS